LFAGLSEACQGRDDIKRIKIRIDDKTTCINFDPPAVVSKIDKLFAPLWAWRNVEQVVFVCCPYRTALMQQLAQEQRELVEHYFSKLKRVMESPRIGDESGDAGLEKAALGLARS
jgi:hypothetical protein